MTVSRSAKDPIAYRSYVHDIDIDASNHGIVTIHPLMDNYGIRRLENPRNVEYYPIVSIDDNAFAGCNWITRINIPASIKTIGRNVFMGCENLKEIYVDANNPYFTSDDGVLYNREKTILIKFPAGKDASSFTIPETVKEIADDAFEGVKMDNNTVSQDEGNPSFDKETNYQFNNAQAYVGETLYLVPLTGSQIPAGLGLGGKISEHYHNFMDYERFDDDLGHCATPNQYKFDPYDYRDYCIAGTHKRHIEGHKFYVDKVVRPYEDPTIAEEYRYKYMWILYLTDLQTGDKLKYIYDGEIRNTQIDFENFPFVVVRHFNYLKSLIGTKLVFATQSVNIYLADSREHVYDKVFDDIVPHYSANYKDINTGEPITFTTPYAKWTIKDVGLDVHESALFFVVSNGENTIKVIYNNQYSTHHPRHNVGNRVFPEKQWDMLVEKYGEKHMSLIMQTQISDDMTLDEKYLAGGRRLATSKKDEKSTSDALKNIGKTAVKSTKKTVSDGVKIIKSIFK